MRRKLEDREIRKLCRKSASLCITIPKEIVDDLKLRKGQKMVVKRRGKSIIIKDWS